MSGKIVTPLKRGDLKRAVRMGGNEEAIMQINVAVTSIRQAAEWGMGAVRKAFPRLLNTLPWNPDVRRVLLDNIHRLYNYRVRPARAIDLPFFAVAVVVVVAVVMVVIAELVAKSSASSPGKLTVSLMSWLAFRQSPWRLLDSTDSLSGL
ncbi:hypothetical protein PsorP6_018808 [Peronosclerospora sorghi]|nr:hypothetical protein PsorP6_018799 [Peronosclerospora sorghi]KAI9895208.1 hypothetical protein PsorP6_018808 [Peronosclerospora sorghi]